MNSIYHRWLSRVVQPANGFAAVTEREMLIYGARRPGYSTDCAYQQGEDSIGS